MSRRGFTRMTMIVVDSVTHDFGVSHAGIRQTVRALDELSFGVAEGEFVSIVGPSGCGKTTLLDMLAGLRHVENGYVTIDGRPPRADRDDVGYMFASDCLLPWRSTLDNAALGLELQGYSKKERYAKSREWLHKVGLGGFESAYASQLSKGMRQRVALIRTFALDTRFLFMDEPFAALDAQTKLLLHSQLLELWEDNPGRSVVFVTHDLQEAVLLSDRVLVLSRRPGRLKLDMPIKLPRPREPKALLADAEFHQLYSRIWEEVGAEMVL